MNTVLANLELPATSTRPCALLLNLGLRTGQLTCIATVNHCVVISAADERAEVAESVALGHVLQIGRIRFKLLPEEVETVRTFLAQVPSPAVPSLPAGYEVTTTAARSPCGDGEATPPAFLGRAGGALDEDDSSLGKALAAREHY